MCGLFLTVKFSCLFTAVAVLACLRSLLPRETRSGKVHLLNKSNLSHSICQSIEHFMQVYCKHLFSVISTKLHIVIRFKSSITLMGDSVFYTTIVFPDSLLL